jgi:predicted RNA-binding protein YlqC (UPF0109 family)
METVELSPMGRMVREFVMAIVDDPDSVELREVRLTGSTVTIVNMNRQNGDVRKVMGGHGRCVNALRTLMSAYSGKMKHTYLFDLGDGFGVSENAERETQVVYHAERVPPIEKPPWAVVKVPKSIAEGASVDDLTLDILTDLECSVRDLTRKIAMEVIRRAGHDADEVKAYLLAQYGDVLNREVVQTLRGGA